MEVAAGTKLGQQARPFIGLQPSVKRGQKWVIQHFQYFPLYPCPISFVPNRQLLLVHHFGSKHAPITTLQLHKVHAPYVAAPKAAQEAEVIEAEPRAIGLLELDRVPTWIVWRRVGFGGGCYVA